MGSTREGVMDPGLFVCSATDEVNPRFNFSGSWFISNKTDDVERRAKTPLTPAIIKGQGQSQEFSMES